MNSRAFKNRYGVFTSMLMCVGMALTLWSLPSVSHAHESSVKRELIVQISQTEVLILLDYEMPPGDQVDRLMVRYDLDHDGLISESEAPRMAGVLLPGALNGLSFEVVGERPKAQEPRVKIRRTKDGKLAMAVLMTYVLPQLDAHKARTLRVTLTPDPHALETPLLTQVSEELLITALNDSPLKPARHKLVQSLTTTHHVHAMTVVRPAP